MIKDNSTITIKTLKQIFSDKDVNRIMFKNLAPNDNSKNQINFGGGADLLHMFPVGQMKAELTSSEKNARTFTRFKAPLDFYWVNEVGQEYHAPNTQLIFYPQYPEVRFSGFLLGCSNSPSELMNFDKRGREKGRVLILGLSYEKVYGVICSHEALLAKELSSDKEYESVGALKILPFRDAYKKKLIQELERIYNKGWIRGKRLSSNGEFVPCISNSNCGGYTLEAELGVSANGIPEPDFMGWEVKQYGVKSFKRLGNHALTLLTPEPDGGLYQDEGVISFITKFGYPDKRGIKDRFNFGGIHRYSERCKSTNLQLDLVGYDKETGEIIDPNGGLALVDDNKEIAALWGFEKVINHWNKKHANTVYVPSIRKGSKEYHYQYGNIIQLFSGTNFNKFLDAVISGAIYYDPGIKIENFSTSKRKAKKRSQFRVKMSDLSLLYETSEIVDLE